MEGTLLNTDTLKTNEMPEPSAFNFIEWFKESGSTVLLIGAAIWKGVDGYFKYQAKRDRDRDKDKIKEAVDDVIGVSLKNIWEEIRLIRLQRETDKEKFNDRINELFKEIKR